MPWKEVKPMDEKILFVADHLRGGHSITDLCRHYGISRKTAYKWLLRYEVMGMSGLAEQSRRPHHSPSAVPYTIRKAIITLRTRGRVPLGAKKIRVLLAKQFSHDVIPAKTTIYNILKAEGLIYPRSPRHRVPPGPQPFAPVQAVNEVWSVDFKGQLKLGNGQWCYPLTVMDHHSRYLLGCRGLTGTRGSDTSKQFIRLFKEYGLPQRIRSDNGVPFATRAAGGLSRLSIWWIRLGITPERITPGRPQQNGRHERMHRTLKQATTTPVAIDFHQQQRRFNGFRQEYNHQRPHEALDQHTPASHYIASSRPYPDVLSELTYPDYYDRHQVKHPGVIYWHNGQVYVSHVLEGEVVGLEEVDDGIWDIHFGPIRLGSLHIRNKKGGKTPYWSLKV